MRAVLYHHNYTKEPFALLKEKFDLCKHLLRDVHYQPIKIVVLKSAIKKIK